MYPRADSFPSGTVPNQLYSDSNPYRPTAPMTFISYWINIMYKPVIYKKLGQACVLGWPIYLDGPGVELV